MAKRRESPFFKIKTQTPTFTKCDDEPIWHHYTSIPMKVAWYTGDYVIQTAKSAGITC